MKVPQNAIEIPAKSFLRLRLFYEAVPRKRNKKGMNLYPAPKYTDSTKRTSPVRNMKFLMKAFCEHDHAIFPLEPDSLVDLAKERLGAPTLLSNDCRIMKPHEPISRERVLRAMQTCHSLSPAPVEKSITTLSPPSGSLLGRSKNPERDSDE